MPRRRFYAPPEAFAPDGAGVTLSAEETRHLRDVLRVRAGDEVSVFDGEGRELACVVEEAGGRGRDAAARLRVLAAAEAPSPESALGLTLAVALLKGEKFDLVVQKATELGASAVVPVLTRRADVRLRDERDAEARLLRWRRLALEAAKQSGRARLPAVESPVALDALLARPPRGGELRLFFAERGGGPLAERGGPPAERAGTEPAEPAAERGERASAVVALVGPEGGWDDEEIESAANHGWRVVTLGGRVLRAETAAVVVAALVQHLYGDLN
ncbi:MAG TPA: 16S rRNA (uracil(1498)-N(3))-methyltransferase [Pyrinomonadaceae bacterium]|nr:16S rRNA (uracil(1498)-N(3))-methyltransferase [Pyrinomonadaceae bacterium]